MKKCILNIRVSEEFRNDLEYQALESETTLSELARHVLWEYLYYEDEELNSVVPEKIPFSQSFRFTFLTAWLFAKFMTPVEHNAKNVIQGIKTVLDEAVQDNTLSNALKFELSKVGYDINRYLQEQEYVGKQFLFPIPNHPGSFDYVVLVTEIWTIHYNHEK